MKKLKAFTLVELLVTMLISSIVIGICYTSYQIVSKQFNDYKALNEKTVEVMLLNELIEKDFLQADSVMKDNMNVVCFNNNNQITYNFNNNRILRKQTEVQDTFFIQSENVQLKFDDKIAENYQSLIDELSFEAKVIGEQEHFIYRKTYAADVLIRH